MRFPALTKIYRIFMVPKPSMTRLFTTMENMNTNWQTWEQPVAPVAFDLEKESKLKLSVEAYNHGDVIVVHCQGRIVYRDEAAALSRVVGEILHGGSKVVLDLSGVSSMDSAGIGEMLQHERNALLHPPGDASALTFELERLVRDPLLRRHIGLAGREGIGEERTWRGHARRIETLVRSLAGGPTLPAVGEHPGSGTTRP